MKRLKTYEELEWKDLNLIKKFKDKKYYKQMDKDVQIGLQNLIEMVSSLRKDKSIETIDMGEKEISIYSHCFDVTLTIVPSKKIIDKISENIIPVKDIKMYFSLRISGTDKCCLESVKYFINSKYYENVDLKISDNYKHFDLRALDRSLYFEDFEDLKKQIIGALTDVHRNYHGIYETIKRQHDSDKKNFEKYRKINKFDKDIPLDLIENVFYDLIEISNNYEIKKIDDKNSYSCVFYMNGIVAQGSPVVSGHVKEVSVLHLTDKNIQIIDILSIIKSRLLDVDPNIRIVASFNREFLSVVVHSLWNDEL